MAQQAAAAGNQRPSHADRLAARWHLFRSDHALLYDALLWRQLEWPSLAVQWQPASWQLPQLLQDIQQADAEEFAAEQEAAEEAEGEEPLAGSTDAAAQQRSSSVDSRHQSTRATDSKQRVLLPPEYQYLLLGDQTSQAAGSHLSLWQVRLPGQLPAGFQPDEQALIVAPGNIERVFEIPHGMQDINKLHSMPEQLHIVATCCDEPQVYLWDLDKAAAHFGGKEGTRRTDEEDSARRESSLGSRSQSESQSGQSEALVAVLGGRSAGGYGLEWSPQVAGLLLGADSAGGVQLWDVQGGCGNSADGCRQLQPCQACPDFADCAINDISWHSSGNVFAAATERGQLLFQDIRAATAAAAASSSVATARGFCNILPSTAKSEQVHVVRDRAGSQATATPDCLSVEFDPQHPYRLASGGADGYVFILDMRKLAAPLEQLGLHAGSVTQVSWSKGAAGLLASAGQDGHILLWDCNKMQHALKQQARSQAAALQGTPAAAAAAAGYSGGGGLGLPAPRQTRASEAAAKLGLPGLLFAHHGHIGPVDRLAWNPSRPWMLASCSPLATARGSCGQEVEVQPTTLMVWEVNRSMGLLC